MQHKAEHGDMTAAEYRAYGRLRPLPSLLGRRPRRLLEELTNWPTYYPSSLDADGLVREMLAH